MMSDISGTTPQAKVTTNPGLASLSLNAHGLLVAFIMAYGAIYLYLVQATPGFTTKDTAIFLVGLTASSIGFVTFTLFIRSFYHVARYQKPKSATIAIGRQMWTTLRRPEGILAGLPAIATLVPFMFIFVQIKNHITAVMPFSWDETFYKLDKALHFGTSPWQWLQPVFADQPYLTGLVNINYVLWFFVMWQLIVHFAFLTKDPVLRTRFFLSFFLTWSVGGSLLAIVFSSAGPAFYGHLNPGVDPYAPLMEILRTAHQTFPVWAIELQDQMWAAYQGNGLDVGISAMPSMHNGLALLFALSLWSTQRKFALILAAHAALIFIGSIWLAWHYAVDAYLAWALAIVFWHISKPVAGWWHGLEPVHTFHTKVKLLAQKPT